MNPLTCKMFDINSQIFTLKDEFKKFVTNPQFPLEERWNVWTSAPEFMKDFHDFYIEWKSLPENSVGYDCFIQHVERYQTVQIDWLVSNLLDYILNQEDRNYKEFDDIPPLTADDQQMWDSFREEVMAKNLWGYTYDW